jgi:hypothetical protein
MITALVQNSTYPKYASPDNFAPMKRFFYNTKKDHLQHKDFQETLKNCLHSAKIHWENYISIKLDETFSEEKPKSLEIGQLHAKTPDIPGSVLTKINALCERYKKIALNPDIPWEEKAVRLQETFPETPSHTAHRKYIIPGINSAYNNGCPYIINRHTNSTAIVYRTFLTKNNILIAAYTPSTEKRTQRVKATVFYEDKNHVTLDAAICQENKTIFISNHPEGFLHTPFSASGEIICGPAQTSILSTAKRVVLCLANLAQIPLLEPHNTLAARLALKLPTFTNDHNKTLFTRTPNLHGGFAHEDGIEISKSITSANAIHILNTIQRQN